MLVTDNAALEYCTFQGCRPFPLANTPETLLTWAQIWVESKFQAYETAEKKRIETETESL